MNKRISGLTAAFVIAATAGLANAQTYVYMPNDNEVNPGASNNAFPFNAGQAMRVQQVFAASQFGGQSGTITEIAFRVDESSGGPFSAGNIDTEIRLCHTSVSPQSMSTTFDSNYGGDVTLVYDGFLTLSSSGSGFDIVIDIDDVFNYDGVSNLLVEYKVFNAANTTQFDAAGTGLGNGGLLTIDRLWAFGANATTGSSGGDDGYVTRLTIEAGGYTCRITGSCPGNIDVNWDGAQPNKTQAIVFASNTGSFTINNGSCAGTQLGLGTRNLQLVRTIGTGSGSGSIGRSVGTGACGGFVQLVTVANPCEVSSVGQIP